MTTTACTHARVMPIGSCRVHNALKYAKSKYNLDANVESQYGFIYTGKEAIQQIHHMNGDFEFSDFVNQFIHYGELEPVVRPIGGASADRYLVEISSRKIIQYESVYLQEPKVRNVLRLVDGHEMFDIMWTDKTGDPAVVRDRMRAHPRFDGLPAEWREFLMTVFMYVQDDDELMADMSTILRLLGRDRVIFVSHCDGIGPNGHRPVGRRTFIDAIGAHAATLGAPFFDPSPHMAAFGQKRGFDREGADTEHYAPAFEDFLARHFIDAFLGGRDANGRASAAASPQRRGGPRGASGAAA